MPLEEGLQIIAVAQQLAGRKAVVTGGASGLGRAIANRLAASGAEITIVDLESTRANVPGKHSFFAGDLSRPDARKQLAGLANMDVDILVANAGVVPPWRRLRDVDGDE